MARVINTRYVEAPPGPPYKTAAEMTELCCEPTGALQCREKVTGVYNGPSDEEILSRLGLVLDADGRDQNGRRVRIQRTERSQPCGKVIRRATIEQLNCCDEVDEIVFDWGSSVEVLAPGASGIVSFTGGRLPALVRIRGNGFSLDGYATRDAVTYSRAFRVYAHEMACGFAPITIDDGCTVAQGGVRASVGEWVLLNNPAGNDLMPADCPLGLSNDDFVAFGTWSPYWEKTIGRYRVRQESPIEQCYYTCVGGGVHGCDTLACLSGGAGPLYHSLVSDFAAVIGDPCAPLPLVTGWTYESDACFWDRCTVDGWPCAFTYRAQHYRWAWEWRC